MCEKYDTHLCVTMKEEEAENCYHTDKTQAKKYAIFCVRYQSYWKGDEVIPLFGTDNYSIKKSITN